MRHNDPLVLTVFVAATAGILIMLFTLAAASDRQANAQSAASMGIDTLVAGNANATVGTIDLCAQINENDIIDADEATNVDLNGDTTPDPDILLIDVVVQGVPAYNDNGTPGDPTDDTGGIIGHQFDLQYPSASLTVVAQSLQSGNPFAPVTSLIGVNAGSSIFDVSAVVPDDNADDSWGGTALDTGTGLPESGSGVLQRVAIHTETGAGAGQVTIALINHAHLDVQGTAHIPISTLAANIAINQACGPVVTPSPLPTPPPTPTPSPVTCPTPAEPSGMCVMGIDTLIAGNANATLGTVDQCARINENNTIDANEAINVDLNGDTTPDPDILLVDITAQGIPAYNDNGTPAIPNDDTGGIIGFQFDFQYPSSRLTVGAQSLQSGNPFAPVTSVIDVSAGSSIFDVSATVPDDNVDDTWSGSALDTGSGIPEQGDGVLQRVAIQTEAGAVASQVIISLANNAHLDAQGTAQFPTNTLFANIAINQACGAILTPTPSPTAPPTPTVPPTPTPSPTRSPSPTPSLAPTFTASPSPTRTASPIPTIAPTPTPTPLPPGFHDAKAVRLAVPRSVNLRGKGTERITFTVMNDGNHFESIGVYLDVIPPTDGNCIPAGRLSQTVLNLNPGDRATLTVDGYPGDPMPGDGKVTFACSQPLAAEGQNYTFILVVDAHADDLAFCPPNGLISAACINNRNNDDADATDNMRIRTGPIVVIH